LKLSILLTLALFCACSPAFAQTEGQISVGVSVTNNNTTDGDVGSTLAVGPLVRLNPHEGWGQAAAFNWFRADLNNPAGGDGDFARLRVRPLMGGIGYSIARGPILTNFSVVIGPSFNKAEFDKNYVPGPGETIEAKKSFAVRPGISATVTVAPRVAIVGFAGYLINRPDIVYRNRFGVETRDHWKADSVVLSIGAVYSLF
jgi:hypothetical protein